MQNTLLGAVMALSLVAGGGALTAYGQPAPPPGGPGPVAPAAASPGPSGPVAAAPRPPGAPWMQSSQRTGAWREGMERGRWRMAQRRWMMARTFGLFFPPTDRQLTPPDVQKIAEAFLLWNGNHTWKVIDVAPMPDGQVSFAYAAPDNTIIARFSMDTKTGRLTRTG
jgi:hypothetical protein